MRALRWASMPQATIRSGWMRMIPGARFHPLALVSRSACSRPSGSSPSPQPMPTSLPCKQCSSCRKWSTPGLRERSGQRHIAEALLMLTSDGDSLARRQLLARASHLSISWSTLLGGCGGADPVSEALWAFATRLGDAGWPEPRVRRSLGSRVQEVPFGTEHPSQRRELAVEHAPIEVAVRAEVFVAVFALDPRATWSSYPQ